MASKRTKVVLLAAGAFLVLGPLLALILLPIWFPWAMKAFTSKTPLKYSRYERVGADVFRLVDVGFTNSGVRFRAGTLESPLPTTWAWQRWQGTASTNTTPVRVENWTLAVEPTGRGSTSVYTNVAQVLRVIDSVAKWLPAAVASNGTATLSGQTLLFSEATWDVGMVTAGLVIPEAGVTGTVKWARQPDGSRRISLVSTQADAHADLLLSMSETTLAVQGQGNWLSNRFDLQAVFDRIGMLPQTASVTGTNLTIPAARLRLTGYQPVRGAFSGEWNHRQFDLATELTAEPEGSRTDYPRAIVRLQASGDTNSALLESATIDLPWLQASLSNPVRVAYKAPFVTAPASFNFAADLTNQPFVPVQGQLRGSLNATRGVGAYPVVDFAVTGANIEYRQFRDASLALSGGLDYPTLRLTNATVTLADSSSATVQGSFDLLSRRVENSSLQARGHLADPWLPQKIVYQDASLEATFRGALNNLSHTGKVTVTEVRLPDLPPFSIATEWSGTNLDLPTIRVVARSTNLVAELLSSVHLTNSSARLGLRVLSIQNRGNALLELQAPSEIQAAAVSNQLRFSTSPLRLAGAAGVLELEGSGLWPSSGHVRLAGTHLSSDALSDLVRSPLSFRIHSLTANGLWSNGPAQLALDLSGSGRWLRAPATNRGLAAELISARLSLAGDGEALAISNLLLAAGSVPLISARGILPLSVWPGASNRIVRVTRSGPINFDAQVSSRSPVWSEIGRLAGMDLREPDLQLKVQGTLRQPSGSLQARIQRIVLRSTNSPPVDLRDLVVDLGFDYQRVRIDAMRVLVQGQQLRFSGGLPLGSQFWDGWRANALPDWRTANLRVQLTNAPVSSFASLFPSLMVPEGLLNVDLALRDGGAHGNLILSGASLRPIPGIGPIHAIDLRVIFDGPTARIENTGARFGTSSLLLSGQADIAGWDWRHEPLPPARLTLRGSEVPLSRTPELILRGDLDLRLIKTNGAPMLVSGNTHFKKSFFLTDLRDLVSSGTAGARRVPPYFSIQTPFLAPWRLDLSATGDDFMKIRSPVFSGQVSANLKLVGTLKEPISLGDVQIDNGLIRFPFASFRVQQGTALVTSQDPTRPQLNVVANAKQFGYDLKLEVSGPADAPILQFSSTPPLSSDRILLMITAGQLPGAEQAVTAQQRAQAFATFLGRDLINKLGGSEPAEPRLTVQSGQQVTDEGRPTYLVEYMFVDDWYLVGEYDRFNEFNVGVKWRFYSK